MKKSTLFAALLAGFTLASCSKPTEPSTNTSNSTPVETVKPTEVKLNVGKSLNLMKDATFQLEATVTPENATDKTVTYESSDSSIISVSETGLVTAVALGNAKVTVKCVGDDTVTKEVTVYSCQAPTGIGFQQDYQDITEVKVELNKTTKVFISYKGDNAYHGGTWTIEDDTIATVDKYGTFKGLKEGKTKATFTSEVAETVKGTIDVTVIKVAELENKTILDFEEKAFGSGYDAFETPAEVKLNNSIVKIQKANTQFGTPSTADLAVKTKMAVMQGGSKKTGPATLEFDYGTKKSSKITFDAVVWSTADKGELATQIEKFAVEQFVDGAWVEAKVIDVTTLSEKAPTKIEATVDSTKVRLIITKKADAPSGKNSRICIDNVTL